MGGPPDGPLASTPREVTMPAAFRISRYEVTQELYRAVMGVNPSRWKGERNSVEMVSFQDAEQFCIRLSAMLQAARLITAKDHVRLPNEAEWEYCCRAGTTTRFSFGDSATLDGDQENAAGALNEFAWHTGNAAGNDPVVGALKPNPWGLYDMHGYLWEFVSTPYISSPAANDQNAATLAGTPAGKAARIIRGGSWRDHHSLLTSHSRLVLPAHAASDAIGFRCVIETSP
jgi:formylglycine-generating enzyme required for sulfatase activity